jgi:ABC-2 type transport system permease protein
MVITLWSVVFASQSTAFGYSKTQLITYVFLASIVQTVVMASPSNDNVGGEIANGDLSNYLTKPISYLKYWFTRDLASKLLNVVFAICEFGLLLLIFRPSLNLFLSYSTLILAIISWIMGIVIYFFVSKISALSAFWIPENTWGSMFFVLVLVEVLSGVIFPLDVLPSGIRFIVDLTPFPYLIYYPISIFVGRHTTSQAITILLKSLVWVILSYQITKKVWSSGLKAYSSDGK